MYYDELLHKIMTEGQPVGDTLELMHQELWVPSTCLFDWPEARPLSKTLEYFKAELPWYLSGDRRAELISPHASLWDKIKNEDGTLNSNYGFLVFQQTTPHPTLKTSTLPAFEWAARALERDVNTRQGMVTYNNGGYNFEGNKDYICSQHQAFYIRKSAFGHLHLLCFVALRSSDSIFGLTHNMPWWQLVYQQMYHRLLRTYPGLLVSDIVVDIYSSHIYSKHFTLVQKMMNEKPFKYDFFLAGELPLGQTFEWYKEHLRVSVAEESRTVCVIVWE